MWVWGGVGFYISVRFQMPRLWFMFRKVTAHCLLFMQNQLFYAPGLNMCLSARLERPSLAVCDPSDRYQLWSFVWACKLPLYKKLLGLQRMSPCVYCMQLTLFFSFFRSMTLSFFNLFLYVEELNCCCCWKVWTLGEIQCLTAGRKHWNNAPQSDCELSFIEQWRCTVLTVPLLCLRCFHYCKSPQPFRIRPIKPTLNMFYREMYVILKQRAHCTLQTRGSSWTRKNSLHVHQREVNVWNTGMVRIVPNKSFGLVFFNNGKPVIWYRPVPWM